MALFRLLFSTASVEAFAKLSRMNRESILDKLDFLAEFPLQPDAVVTALDGIALDVKTLGAWTFAYSVDFPSKTIIVAWFTRIPRNSRRE